MSLTSASVAISLLLIAAEPSPDGGASAAPGDAPLVLQLEGPGECGAADAGTHYCVNEPAFVKLDEELKRLQAVEKAAQPGRVVENVVLGLVIGILLGGAGGVAVGLAVKK